MQIISYFGCFLKKKLTLIASTILGFENDLELIFHLILSFSFHLCFGDLTEILSEVHCGNDVFPFDII